MTLQDRLHILVVDDMSTSRSLILQALQAMGFRKVETAPNGQIALDLLAHRPIHLVLSDFHMPDMTGIDLLRAIRSSDAARHTGFILVTGRTDPDILDEGRKLGLNNLLRKPFTPHSMHAVLKAVVGPF